MIRSFLPIGLYLITAIAAINATILNIPETIIIMIKNICEPTPLPPILDIANIPKRPIKIPNIPYRDLINSIIPITLIRKGFFLDHFI